MVTGSYLDHTAIHNCDWFLLRSQWCKSSSAATSSNKLQAFLLHNYPERQLKALLTRSQWQFLHFCIFAFLHFVFLYLIEICSYYKPSCFRITLTGSWKPCSAGAGGVAENIFLHESNFALRFVSTLVMLFYLPSLSQSFWGVLQTAAIWDWHNGDLTFTFRNGG